MIGGQGLGFEMWYGCKEYFRQRIDVSVIERWNERLDGYSRDAVVSLQLSGRA